MSFSSQDQVDGRREIGSDPVSAGRGRERAVRGHRMPPAREQDAATAGVQAGQHVAHLIADHPRGAQVDPQLVGPAEQHAGGRLAVRAIRAAAFGRRGGAVVDAVERRAAGREPAFQLGVDRPQPVLGEEPPADARLVGHQHPGEAGAPEPHQGLRGPGQEADPRRVGEVRHVLDQRAVAVEEDRGPAAVGRRAAGGPPRPHRARSLRSSRRPRPRLGGTDAGTRWGRGEVRLGDRDTARPGAGGIGDAAGMKRAVVHSSGSRDLPLPSRPRLVISESDTLRSSSAGSVTLGGQPGQDLELEPHQDQGQRHHHPAGDVVCPMQAGLPLDVVIAPSGRHDPA